MAQDLSNRYFVRRTTNDAWQDVTTLFDGVKILSLKGFNEVGDAQNIYTAQWVNSQTEDYMLVDTEVVRSNIDLTMTFIVGTRFSASQDVDTQATYDAFKAYICDHGDFWIKSAYTNKYAHVVCLKGVQTTTERLHRGQESYILASATLHTLSNPTAIT